MHAARSDLHTTTSQQPQHRVLADTEPLAQHPRTRALTVELHQLDHVRLTESFADEPGLRNRGDWQSDLTCRFGLEAGELLGQPRFQPVGLGPPIGHFYTKATP